MNIKPSKLFLAIALAFVCVCLLSWRTHGEIIPADRLPGGQTWNAVQPGVVGGIPNVTNIYTTLSPGANDWGAINTALLDCPSNQVVYLNAGTYTITNSLYFGPVWNSSFYRWGNNGVVLRGAGPGKTILVFEIWNPIAIWGNDIWGSGPQPSDAVDWTGGYTQGSTSISIAASGIGVGTLIMLTQENDPNLVNVAGTGSPTHIFTDSGGKECNQVQWVRVTGVDGTGTNLTIWPGVYMTNYRTELRPQILRHSGNGPALRIGVEEMTLDLASEGPGTPGIGFNYTYDCWVKNLETAHSSYAAVQFLSSAHGTVEHCYFHDTSTGGGAVSYGVNVTCSSNILANDNIFYRITSPGQFDSGTSGSVFAYNFCTNMVYGVAPGWMAFPIFTHGAHPTMNLFEGNVGTGLAFDIIHGSSSHNTVFRNYFSGYETNLENYTAQQWLGLNNTYCVSIMESNRFESLVGNVLGTGGYHTNYSVDVLNYPTNYGNIRTIYLLGFFGNYGGAVNQDPLTITTLLREGNYDYASGSNRWDTSPQTIPTSLYLSSKPAWWGTTPWPPIGSDLTPMNSMIPAQMRFFGLTNNPPAAATPVGQPPWGAMMIGFIRTNFPGALLSVYFSDLSKTQAIVLEWNPSQLLASNWTNEGYFRMRSAQ